MVRLLELRLLFNYFCVRLHFRSARVLSPCLFHFCEDKHGSNVVAVRTWLRLSPIDGFGDGPPSHFGID